MLAQLSFSGLDWLPILFAIAAAYIVFGIAGFGTALVAGPVLIHFMPLSRIIPLLVLLDFVAAFGNLLPSRGMWYAVNCCGCCPSWPWVVRWAWCSCCN